MSATRCFDHYGIEWMGDLSSGWSVHHVKRHFGVQLGKMLQNEPSSPSDRTVPYMKALHVQWGQVDISDLPEMWVSPTDLRQYGICAGDLLVCEGGEAGRASVVDAPPPNCIIQNALHRVRALDSDDVRYLYYVLYAVNAAGWFNVLCNRATIAHFTKEKLADLRMPIPTCDEQRAIATFLDRETARIDALIEKKRRQIELLHEKRAALISHAVTKGLDPKAKMRDSGIEWLGEVPAHWERQSIGRLCYLGRGKVMSNIYMQDHSGEFPVYSSQTDEDGAMGWIDSYMFDGEYLTWTTDGANAGTVFYRNGKFSCTNVCGTLKAKVDINLAYLCHALAIETRRYVRLDINPKLMNNVMARILVLVPPTADQSDIVTFLDRETVRIDTLIDKVSLSIGRLREYRTALISAAVTGKIDVREVFA